MACDVISYTEELVCPELKLVANWMGFLFFLFFLFLLLLLLLLLLLFLGVRLASKQESIWPSGGHYCAETVGLGGGMFIPPTSPYQACRLTPLPLETLT